jgi:hypothetical protein
MTSQILSPELDLTVALTWTPKVGELVENFGQIAQVLEVRPAPYNDLVLREVGKRSKWIAVAANCRPVR